MDPDTPAPSAPDGTDAREPDDSPARRLAASVAAYEVDPPAPDRVRDADTPDGSALA